MSRFELFLDKINFKKAFKIFASVSIVLILLCILTVAYVTRDILKLAFNYGTVSESFERRGISEDLKSRLKALSSSSGDIINCIIVDKDGNVVYKANSKLIDGNNKFLLAPYKTNARYLQDNINSDVVYNVVRKETIIFNMGYVQKHEKIMADIDENFYYERDLGSKNIYLLNYSTNRETKDKVFIIRTVTPIPYAERLLEVTGLIAGLIFTVYWIGLALWVYRDANRKRSNATIWGLITLLTNIVGLIVYTMFKLNNNTCYKCGTLQSKENVFCTSCGTQINEVCSECSSIADKRHNYCGKCGHDLK